MYQDMFGPSRHAAKGKSIRTQPDGTGLTLKWIDAPKTIKKLHHKLVLVSDTILLNGVPSLTRFYQHVHYGLVGTVDNLKCPSLEHVLKK